MKRIICALAVVATGLVVGATPAAAVDSPTTICNRWRPHGSSDTVFAAETFHMTQWYVRTQCVANHPGANHYYCVTTWWNDAETWDHPCYDGLG